jgi:hypothetical protein
MNYDLEEFKKMYFKEFGVMLTDEKAEVNARVLMSLFKMVYGSPDLTLEQHERNKT